MLIDPNEPPQTGALDTIAFTAQRARGAADDSTAATGQVQVNRRSGEALKFHGVVDCLVVIGTKSSGEAFISGESRDGEPFELYVRDGGAGTNERGADTMMVWYAGETSENDPDGSQPPPTTGPPEDSFCGIEEDPEQVPALGRGNVQVYDASEAGSASAGSRKSSTTSTSSLSLAGLR